MLIMENSKKYILFSVIGIVVVALLLLSRNSKNDQNASNTERETTASVGTAFNNKGESELKIEDLTIGTGREAECNTALTVHYTGWLTDGTKFDSSLNRGVPFVLPLCAGHVIQGWDIGLQGMKEGGKRKLTIPPSLAYGDKQVGPIPANSTLVFEVELLKVEGVSNQ